MDGELEGSPMKDEYAAIYDNLPASKPLSAAIDRYNKAFRLYNDISMTDENYRKLKESSALLDSLQKAQRQQIFDMIPQKPTSKAMALMVFYYSGGLDADEQERLLNQFDSSIRECYGVRSLQKRIDYLRGSEVGAVAPDFELTTPEGEKVKLSSFRGKYVLIDFWASWCGPCRKALPLVKKVYEDFKDKGLQVIGVSIDKNEADWRQALEEEQLPYLQLHDPNSATQRLYNFDGIPFIILISPDGILLERELFGDEIRKAVEKHVK